MKKLLHISREPTLTIVGVCWRLQITTRTY